MALSRPMRRLPVAFVAQRIAQVGGDHPFQSLDVEKFKTAAAAPNDLEISKDFQFPGDGLAVTADAVCQLLVGGRGKVAIAAPRTRQAHELAMQARAYVQRAQLENTIGQSTHLRGQATEKPIRNGGMIANGSAEEVDADGEQDRVGQGHDPNGACMAVDGCQLAKQLPSREMAQRNLTPVSRVQDDLQASLAHDEDVAGLLATRKYALPLTHPDGPAKAEEAAPSFRAEEVKEIPRAILRH